MKRLLGIVAAIVMLSLAHVPESKAQVFVISSCGTVPASMKTLVPGAPGMFFTDATGVLCTSAVGGGGGTSSNFGAAFPTPGTAAGFTDGTNMVAGRVRNPGSGALVGDPAIVVADPNLLAAVNAPIPTGGNSIGSVGSDPSKGPAAPSSVAINVSTATTTQLVAINASTAIYVTSYDVIAGGTGNITFVYGTGASCVTGTTSLTGPYPLTAQAGIAKGSGVGTLLKVPAGNALCVTTSAAVQMSGSVSYQQF